MGLRKFVSKMTYGSVCSGIETAALAWVPLGWRAAWVSEIDPFASGVLSQRQKVKNQGDMRHLPAKILDMRLSAPEVVAGGMPCQAFSVAGIRDGLNDPRGALTLSFCKVVEAVDTVRRKKGLLPSTVIYENVPGVLSDNTNAFGCLLSALCGADEALETENGKWPSAGLVCGPRRRVAWCILDAQWFGLAQQRRRVWLVAQDLQTIGYCGERACPGSILSLGSCRRGDTPSRKEIWERDPSNAEGGPAPDRVIGANCPNGSITGEIAHTISSSRSDLSHQPTILVGGRIRRMTAEECEKAMGIPPGYTRIRIGWRPPNRCPDRPRYRVIGNAWAVPCAKWIGERVTEARYTPRGDYLCETSGKT